MSLQIQNIHRGSQGGDSNLQLGGVGTSGNPRHGAGGHLIVPPPARTDKFPVLRRPSHQIQSQQRQEQVIIYEKSMSASRQILTKQYMKGNFLGKGGFAKVYEIRNMELDHTQAVKVVPKSTLTKSRAKQKLQSEIRIHRSMHHANIVQFENFFEDEDNVYIIMELCSNSTLNEQIKRRKRLSELEVQCFGQQILQAIKYMHQHRVIHRDLKLGNLFLNEKMQVKTGDFGLAAKLEFKDEKRRTVCGTPNYIAPEVLEQKQGHSFEVDIWSFGVIMYAMIIGKPPFETSEIKQTYKRIKAIQYSFPEAVPISEEAKDLITRILVLDPAKRPSIDEILDHPFFHRGNKIPRLLPPSTLACPPSDAFMKQFQWNTIAQQSPMIRASTASAQVLPGRQSVITLPKLHTYGSRLRLKPTDSGGAKLQLPTKSILSTKLNKRGPTVWVKKWVDYSSKYGLGYTLSNGTCGVYFNDNSKMIRDASGKVVTFFERNSASRQEDVNTYVISEAPKEIQKKVLLMKHFAEYLEGNKDSFQEEGQSPSPDAQNQYRLLAGPLSPTAADAQQQVVVVVKKWVRTKHAILFRLNNKVVQVCFQDNSQIILCSDSRLVCYVNRTGTRQTMSLQEALDSPDYEMVKRLKYTKDIVQEMIGARVANRAMYQSGQNHAELQ